MYVLDKKKTSTSGETLPVASPSFQLALFLVHEQEVKRGLGARLLYLAHRCEDSSHTFPTSAKVRLHPRALSVADLPTFDAKSKFNTDVSLRTKLSVTGRTRRA